MRSNGVSEDYITGDRPDYERFLKFVEALEMAIGNPMYHWCNLELRQFFGYNKPLTVENAEEAWNFCNEKLRTDPDLTVRGIIKKANVAFIGTTDDPVDTLEWHGRIAADESIDVKVCPSFRPDKAINIQKEGFAEYIGKLAQSVGKESLDTADEVMDALVQRLEFFKTMGCRASDHGLDYVPFRPASTAWIMSPSAPPPPKRSTRFSKKRWPARAREKKRPRSTRRPSCCAWAKRTTGSESSCRSTIPATETPMSACSANWGPIPALT